MAMMIFFKDASMYLQHYLIILFFIIIVFSITPYVYPELDCMDYGQKHDGVGYEIIKKINTADNHFFLSLCWIVDNEIYVGESITIYAKIYGPHYENNIKYDYITITFLDTYLNYWNEYSDDVMNNYIQGPRYENITKIYEMDYIDNNDVDRLKYNYTNKIIAYPNFNHTLFKSEPINFRFIVPEIIDVTYCEYPLIKKCDVIHNIIKPASYDLGERLRTNNILVENSEILKNYSEDLKKDSKNLFHLTIVIMIISFIIMVFSFISLWNIFKLSNILSRYISKSPKYSISKSPRYRIIMIGIFSGLTIILFIILYYMLIRIHEFSEKIQP